jgi:hypothetical protein
MRFVLLGSLLLVSLTSQSATSQRQDVDPQPAVVRDLLGTDFKSQNEAAQNALDIAPKNRSEELWSAIFSEADRLNHEMLRRADSIKKGETVRPDHALGEYRGLILQLAAQSDDPAVIQILVESNGSPVAMKGMAKFGEKAVPQLAAAAASSTLTADQIAGVLGAFEMMLSASAFHPISAESKNMMVDAARTGLGANEDPTIVFAAIGLAVETRDADLRQQVQEWANDPVRLKPKLAPIWIGVLRDHARKALQRRVQ